MSDAINIEYPLQGSVSTSTGGGDRKIMTFYTSLVLDPNYSGNIHIEIMAFDNIDESGYFSADSYISQTNFKIFDGTNYGEFPTLGMPSIFDAVVYVGTDVLDKTYVKWRIKDEDNVPISDWVAGELAFGGKDNLRVYDIAEAVYGKPEALAEVHRFEATRSFSFPADMVGSRASTKITSIASAVFSVRKNDVEFAVFTFTSGIADAVFSNPANDESFVTDDILSVISPSPQDDTLSTISWTLKGEL